jgi:hypothetical protein
MLYLCDAAQLPMRATWPVELAAPSTCFFEQQLKLAEAHSLNGPFCLDLLATLSLPRRANELYLCAMHLQFEGRHRWGGVWVMYGWEGPWCTFIMGKPARTQQIDRVVMILSRFSAIRDQKDIQCCDLSRPSQWSMESRGQSRESPSSWKLLTGCMLRHRDVARDITSTSEYTSRLWWCHDIPGNHSCVLRGLLKTSKPTVSHMAMMTMMGEMQH